MANKSRIQGMSERVAARVLGVGVDEVRAVLADKDNSELLVGRAGFDIWALVLVIMQVLIDQIGNCPARRNTFEAIRKPGMFARVHMRRRAAKTFADSPYATWQRHGSIVAVAIEEEAAESDDSELAAMFVEAQNPPIDLMLI